MPSETHATFPSTAENLLERPVWQYWRTGFLLGFVGLVPLFVAWYSLNNQGIEGLDQAHHIMTGIFFRDLLMDHPLSHIKDYVFNYHMQYPALGFKFWPPFFPLIEGFFFSIFGVHIVVARWCLLAFGVLLAVLMYLVAEDSLSRLISALATTVVLTTSLMVEHLNTVMLEIPALTMAFLTVLLYQRVVRRGKWKNWLEVVTFAFVGAASVYTKQTIIFIFPVLFIDLAVNHRSFLRLRSTWVAAVLLVLLCMPLLVFTLKFSPENLVQSFGNKGDVYMKVHKVAPRWSIYGWIYYIQQIGRQCQLILVGLAMAGLGYCLMSRQFAQRNTIWIAWIICWYLLFSYFDNKQPRFVTFVVPGVIILGCSFVWALLKRKYWGRRTVFIGLAVIIIWQAMSVSQALPRSFSGMDKIVDELFYTEKSNIVYVGNYRQLFIPFVRISDSERNIYILRGERLLNSKKVLNTSHIAHQYRIKWLLIEPTSSDALDLQLNIQHELTTGPFELVGKREFGTPSQRIELHVYRYEGAWADRMERLSFE